MAFAQARPGEESAAEFGPGAAEVVCRTESLLAAEAGTRGEVALVWRTVEAGSRTPVAMIRLTGEGVVFLCAQGSAATVALEAGEALEAACWGSLGTRDSGLPDAGDGGRQDVQGDARVDGRHQWTSRVVLQGQRGGMRG